MPSQLRSVRLRIILAFVVVAIVIFNSLPTTAGTRPPADDTAVTAYLDGQVADAGYPGASIIPRRAGTFAAVRASRLFHAGNPE